LNKREKEEYRLAQQFDVPTAKYGYYF